MCLQYRGYPLHIACAKVSPSVVHDLLRNGADATLVHPEVEIYSPASCAYCFRYGKVTLLLPPLLQGGTALDALVMGCRDEPGEGWKDILLALKRAGAIYQGEQVRGATCGLLNIAGQVYIFLTHCFSHQISAPQVIFKQLFQLHMATDVKVTNSRKRNWVRAFENFMNANDSQKRISRSRTLRTRP